MFFPCFNWRIILNYQWISPNLAMFSHLWAATSWLRDWCPSGWQWNGPVALKVLQPSGPSAAIGAPRPQGDTPWCPHLKKRWKITWWWQVQFFGLNLFWVCFFPAGFGSRRILRKNMLNNFKNHFESYGWSELIGIFATSYHDAIAFMANFAYPKNKQRI